MSKDWIRAQLRTLQETRTERVPLLDYVPKVSPHLARPTWLAPLVDALERAAHGPVRLVVSTPPQHGKSSLAHHFIVREIDYAPTRPLLYLTYNDDFAVSQMRRAKPIAEHAGVKLVSRGLTEWQTDAGGVLYATGVGGSITGRPGGLVVIDDPIKDWVSAQSRRLRDAVDDWLRSVVITRLHPSSSVIVIQTRWHVDDIAGRLIQRGWDAVNLPAISADGRALWPEERPLEWLEQQREAQGSRMFAALYQGEPVPASGTVFVGATLTDTVPTTGRYAIGLDLAYTSRARADYSVALVMCKPIGEPATIVDVVRRQCTAPDFALVLESLRHQYPGAPFRWYASGTERGAADFLSQRVAIDVLNATGDKRVRSQHVAAAWERGDVRVPREATWAPMLLDELGAFTGDGDAHDDQVDALAAAYDALAGGEVRVSTVENRERRAVRRLRGAY